MKVIRSLLIGQFIVGLFLVYGLPTSSAVEVYGIFIAIDILGIGCAYLMSRYLLLQDISFVDFLKDRW